MRSGGSFHTQPGGGHDPVAADLDRAQLREGHRFVGLERRREAPVEAGADRPGIAAERGDHRLLAFLHDEEAAAHPAQRHDAGDEADADARTIVGVCTEPAGVTVSANAVGLIRLV